MPAVFPTPLPEEPVYSVAARYGDMMGLNNPTVLARALFGSGDVAPVVEMPGYVAGLLKRLPPGHTYTADEFLERHTALPYYRAFIDAERAARLASAMRDGAAGRIPGLLGPSRSALPPVERLRFCDACAAEDRAAHGVPYWRRVHQLPGVIVCPTHSVPLFDSVVDRRRRQARPGFVSLAKALADGGGVQHVIPTSRLALATDIAADSLWLLQHPTVVAGAELTTAHARWERMKLWLNAAGLRRGRGLRLPPAQVITAVESAVGADILSVLCQSASSQVGIASIHARTATSLVAETTPPRVDVWVFNMMRRRRYAEYPLLYLVLLRALGVSTQRFFSTLPDDPPPSTEAEAVTRCINPVCEASSSPIRHAASGARGALTTWVDVVCPACGYHYTAPINNDCRETRRVVAAGPLWEARLRDLIEQEATGGMIEEALGLALATVQRHAYRLGVWHPRWTENARESVRRAFQTAAVRAQALDAVRIATRDAYRARWLSLRASHPEAGRAELMRLGHAVHAHLYDYDRDWLLNNLPAVLAARRRRPAPDWAGRDDAFVAHVEATVREMRSRPGRPVQITAAAVLRTMQGTRLWPSWLPHMPRTRMLLEQSVEDADAFARRVVVYYATRAAADRELLSPSALRNRAGIGSGRRAACRELIQAAARAVRAHVEYGTALPATWSDLISLPSHREHRHGKHAGGTESPRVGQV